MITDVPSSSSSSSPSVKTRRWINHIFISFRGADTRKGFTDHLYAALERRGCIKTFKDDHDLESGEIISEGLIKGIQESMFALVVLSPNYASSRWCLDELQNIIECREKFNQVVFPIFYGVESSDVRYQRGTFEEAFRKHEERFKEEKGKVQRWRDALQKVASYSGWDSKDKRNQLEMHDLLQEMGKNIVFQESPNDPGKRSRLWSQDDISRVLSQNKGTEAIQAIVDYARAQPYEARWFSELIQPAAHYYQLYEAKWSSEESKSFVESEEIQAIVESYTARRKSEEIQAIVDYDRPYNARWSSEEIQAIFEDIQAIVAYVRPYEARWSSEAFSKTSNIRLLKIRNACCLSHGLDCLPYALRVLDWHGCPLKTLPLTDQLDVVDINLSWSKIEQLWHGTKILHKLKCINLSFSGNLNQTPDFVEVPNLQSLVLEGCTSLTEIHSSVMQLKKLVQLNLKGCKRLKALPGNIKAVSFAGCKGPTSEFNCFRVPSAVCGPSLLIRGFAFREHHSTCLSQAMKFHHGLHLKSPLPLQKYHFLILLLQLNGWDLLCVSCW
ncbi:TMV resistance protein N [Arachis hypogaea]|nr:TMV resistance protein N [Arachis hypogaea]